MSDPSDDAARAARSQPSERTARLRRDRRHQWTVVAIALVAGLIAASLGTNRGRPPSAAAQQPTTTTAPPLSRATAILLAHVNARHEVDLLAVAGVRTGGRTGSVVFVPTATLVQVPAFDSQSLADVFRLGRNDLLLTTVENALGVRFDQELVLNDSQLTDLFSRAGSFDVDFENPVEVNDSAGTLGFTAGRAHVSSADATRLLLGPTTGGSLQHLATVQADLPDALLTTASRRRVEILNGTGAVALTQNVARLVVPAGGEITLTGNVPGFGVKHTTVVYYRPDDLPEANRIAAALGVGSVAKGNVPLDVVDVTVVVGSDFHPKRH
jgi:hypothetical protein